MQVRHGDLLIESVKKNMETLKDLKTKIVEEGEATGHAHRLDGNGTVLSDVTGIKYIQSMEDSLNIIHEEHNAINLPTGLYKVTRQREYDALEKASRSVID